MHFQFFSSRAARAVFFIKKEGHIFLRRAARAVLGVFFGVFGVISLGK